MKRLPIVLLSMLAVACSSIDCPVQNTVSVLYNVCNADGSALTLSDTLTVTSMRNDGTDTTLLNLFIGSDNFTLPISYSHPEDILLFTFANVNNDSLLAVDTVWVKKQDIPHFESVDCNASFFHELTGVRHTRNYIDSLVISNSSVTYDQETVHFRLYPKVSD